MDAPLKNNSENFYFNLGTRVKAYRELCEPVADDASFLWVLRSIVVNQPDYNSADLIALDTRIDATFNALMTAPEESWDICASAMSIQQSGELFAAANIAFRSLDVRKIQQVVEAGMQSKEAFIGLAGALAWLPGRLCHSWIKKFLTSKDLDHKHLAVTVCSLRREDPREYLTAIIQREDCMAHQPLYARSIRLIGELKRMDLAPAVRLALQSKDPMTLFWATWSSILLGDKSVIENLKPFVLSENPYQSRAIDLAFRLLPTEAAREWINLLAKNPQQIRQVIRASVTFGDPHAINWLITQMRVPALMRLAGEAFSTITGIALEEHRLALEELPQLEDQLPSAAANDDLTDGDVDLSDDDRLPFPSADKIAAVWQKYQQRFIPGRRYFMGQQLSSEHLLSVYTSGNQRQRRAAALELALLQSDHFLLNYAAKDLSE